MASASALLIAVTDSGNRSVSEFPVAKDGRWFDPAVRYVASKMDPASTPERVTFGGSRVHTLVLIGPDGEVCTYNAHEVLEFLGGAL
jgi:hypothetical protein